MKKKEFETEVRKHLEALQKLYKEFAPEDSHVLSMGVYSDYYHVFILRKNENGEAIEGDYILDITHIDEE